MLSFSVAIFHSRPIPCSNQKRKSTSSRGCGDLPNASIALRAPRRGPDREEGSRGWSGRRHSWLRLQTRTRDRARSGAPVTSVSGRRPTHRPGIPRWTTSAPAGRALHRRLGTVRSRPPWTCSCPRLSGADVQPYREPLLNLVVTLHPRQPAHPASTGHLLARIPPQLGRLGLDAAVRQAREIDESMGRIPQEPTASKAKDRDRLSIPGFRTRRR